MPYQDSWEKDTLHYTGQGKVGDQKLTRNNKKIVEANQDNITIHLFESFVKGENIYRGIVYLSQKPYQIGSGAKNSVVFGRLLSSKHSLPKINLV